MTKYCTKCKEHHDISQFGRDNSKSDGYYSSCKTSNKARRKRQYHKDREANIEKTRQWQLLNPEKTTTYKKNNKYKRRELINQSLLPTKDLRLWEDEQFKICSYCSSDCTDNYQIDHIEPLSTGGEHSLDNLTIACPTCNRKKSNTPLLLWYAYQQIIRS